MALPDLALHLQEASVAPGSDFVGLPHHNSGPWLNYILAKAFSQVFTPIY